MLGCIAIVKRNGCLEILDQKNCAEITPAQRARLGAREVAKLPLDCYFARRSESLTRCRKDRLRSGIVLRLSKEVSGEPVGIVVLVGDDQPFRWPGDHVDADRTEDDAFG